MNFFLPIIGFLLVEAQLCLACACKSSNCQATFARQSSAIWGVYTNSELSRSRPLTFTECLLLKIEFVQSNTAYTCVEQDDEKVAWFARGQALIF